MVGEFPGGDTLPAVNWANLAAMLGIHVAGMTTPGPDIFLVLRTATRSRRHALAAVAGIITGLMFWVTLTVVGVAAVLASVPALLGAIQLIGGLWIAYMAWGMLRGGVTGVRELRAGAEPPPLEKTLGTVAGAYRQGLLTNLSNPKVVLFMAAVLSRFMPVGAPFWVQLVYIAAILLASVLYFGTVAMLVSTDAMTRRMVRAGPWIDLVSGVVFAVVAVFLLVEGGLAVAGTGVGTGAGTG